MLLGSFERKGQTNEYSDNLYKAIKSNDKVRFEWLLAKGGDLNKPRFEGIIADYENVYPLEIACRVSSYMANRLLDKGANPKVVNEYLLSTPLIFCLEGNDVGRFQLAKRLIAGGAKINQVDKSGRSALNSVVEITSADDEQNIAQGVSLLEYLLDHSDVDKIVKATANNPLNMAVRYQNYEAVKYILENEKIDIDLKSKGGYTPLMRAVMKENIEICKLLLDYGADVRPKADDGEDVFDLAKAKGNTEIFKLLMKY